MPNHIHGIIEISYTKEKNEVNEIGKFLCLSQSIGSIVRGYKITTIKKIKEYISDDKSKDELQFAPTIELEVI